MTTVNLGRIKSVWRGTWASGIAYSRDDVVQEGVNSYICVQAHTSGATFAGDSANWNVMAVGAEIPSQTGFSGKSLLTDGSGLYWGDGGQVLQVKYANKTDIQYIGSYNFTDVTGLSVTISPKSSQSKILILADLKASTENNASWGGGHMRVLRNGTQLHFASSGGANKSSTDGGLEYGQHHMGRNYQGMFVDTPATTSPLTYKLQFAVSNYTGPNGYINRAYEENTSYSGTGASGLIVMEVVA